MQPSTPSTIASRSLTTPPGSPNGETYYIVPTGATGAWASNTLQLTWYENGAWKFVVPSVGLKVYAVDEGNEVIWTGTKWAPGSIYYDVIGYIQTKPAGGSIALYVPIPRAMTFPAAMVGSFAKAQVAATSSTVFTMYHNGTSMGTFTFAASATSATFSVASATTFAAGDIFEVTAPAGSDATLANVGFSFAGILS